MKKLILLAFLFATVAIQAQVTAYDSYVDFPQGSAQRIILADTGINTISVHNNVCYAIQSNLETAADTVKANMTVKVTIGAGVKVGSLLYVEIQTGAKASPYTVAFSTGCEAVTITPTASKKQMFILFYNGTKYRLINKYNCN